MKVKCLNAHCSSGELEVGKIYEVDLSISPVSDFYLKNVGCWRKDRFEIVEDNIEQKPIDKHYNFNYDLSAEDRKKSSIKVDPYFVANVWKLGEKDNTGVLFHCLKTIARFSEKNSKEREIKALYKQIKRLAELENVDLES
jgi:hypothetical protein